jgi:hypothetical protein
MPYETSLGISTRAVEINLSSKLIVNKMIRFVLCYFTMLDYWLDLEKHFFTLAKAVVQQNGEISYTNRPLSPQVALGFYRKCEGYGPES